jgi:hypothetical protein
MDQENKNIEIKANLYSILKTIPNLNDKYEEGSISEVFFQKSIKNAINSLVNIKILLTQDKIFFSDYIKEINLIEEYNSAISIINKLSSLDFSDDSSERIKSSILELPGITSEITSSFITLMDALKLDSLHDSDLISKLFTELINNIRKFPGLEDIKYKINEISEVALRDVDSLVNNNKLEVIGDELYSLFLVFQNSIR